MLFSSLLSASDIVPSGGMIFGAKRSDEAEIVKILKKSWKQFVKDENIITFKMSLNEINKKLRESGYEYVDISQAFEIMIWNDCKAIIERKLKKRELKEIIIKMNRYIVILKRMDIRHLGPNLQNWREIGSFVKALFFEGKWKVNQIVGQGHKGECGSLIFWENLAKIGEITNAAKVGEEASDLENAGKLSLAFFDVCKPKAEIKEKD